MVGASEGEEIGCKAAGKLPIGGEPVLVFEVRAQVDAVVEPVIQPATEGDEVVSEVVDISHDAARGDELMGPKIYDTAAIENLAVRREPAVVVVAEIAAADLVRGLGEVVAGNKRIGVGIPYPMKVGFDTEPAEEVIVSVEGEAMSSQFARRWSLRRGQAYRPWA